jgi:XTP/dITP diphosphohydrolase
MKQNLLIATQNRGKLLEVQDALAAAFVCLSPSQATLRGQLSDKDLEETGQTYYENALQKALTYYRAFQIPTLADDSGFEVDALDHGPGVYSARFGGENLSWSDRWKLIHEKLKPVPPERWNATFRCVLCYYDGYDVPKFFEAAVQGMVTPEARGDYGFGYDPIFFSSELGKTFGEATPSEKALVNHRTKAIHKFLASIVPV